MSEYGQVGRNQHPFYSGEFAWLPIGIYEKGNEHNSATVAIRWLWFVVRDAGYMGFGFSFSLNLDGLHLRVGIPYINAHLRVEFPITWSSWGYRNIYRRGEKSKYKWMR